MQFPTVCTENVMNAAQASVDAYFAHCLACNIKPRCARDEKLQYEMAQEHSRERLAKWRASIAGDKVAQIRAAKNDLANKDRWTSADYAENDRLSRDMRAALIDA